MVNLPTLLDCVDPADFGNVAEMVDVILAIRAMSINDIVDLSTVRKKQILYMLHNRPNTILKLTSLLGAF